MQSEETRRPLPKSNSQRPLSTDLSTDIVDSCYKTMTLLDFDNQMGEFLPPFLSLREKTCLR